MLRCVLNGLTLCVEADSDTYGRVVYRGVLEGRGTYNVVQGRSPYEVLQRARHVAQNA